MADAVALADRDDPALAQIDARYRDWHAQHVRLERKREVVLDQREQAGQRSSSL